MNINNILTAMKDYYIILGLPKEADKSRIKKAYRDIAKKLHPDKSASRENRRKFLEAKEAYETLTDEAARKKYDRELVRQQNDVEVGEPTRRKKYSSFRTGKGPVYPSDPHIYKTGASCRRDYWLKMVLSPEQARCGGDFTVTLPFIQLCPGCRHQRDRSPFFCLDCFGRGFISIKKEFIVTLPPDMASGDTFRQLAYDNGFFALFLNVVIRIDPLL